MGGKVLLRAANYQWITRQMVLDSDSLSLYRDTKDIATKASLEVIDLVGATCEAVVVSSEHLNCFRVIEMETDTKPTTEWIFDACSPQDKQTWIASVQTRLQTLKISCARKTTNVTDIDAKSGIDIRRLVAARRLIQDLQAQRGNLFLRGKDVLDVLQKHVGCTSRTEALVLGNTLLNEGFFKHIVSQYALLDDDCLFETVSRTHLNLLHQCHVSTNVSSTSTDINNHDSVASSTDDDNDDDTLALQNQSNGESCPELHNLFVSVVSEIDIQYIVADTRSDESMSMSAVDFDLNFADDDVESENMKVLECFYGDDAVEAFMSRGLLNEEAAVILGNQLLGQGYFYPLKGHDHARIFHNRRTQYVISSDFTRSFIPTMHETIVEWQSQVQKRFERVKGVMDIQYQGIQMLCGAITILYFLESSLHHMPLYGKLIIVSLFYIGKVKLHDSHALEHLVDDDVDRSNEPLHMNPPPTTFMMMNRLRQVHDHEQRHNTPMYDDSSLSSSSRRRRKGHHISNGDTMGTGKEFHDDIHTCIEAKNKAHEDRNQRLTCFLSTSTSSSSSSSSSSLSSSLSGIQTPPYTLNAHDQARVETLKKMLDIDDENSFLLRDLYLHTVLSVKNRTVNYAAEKMQRAIEWRIQYGAPSITADDVRRQFESCSMYWYGYDNEKRPIFWARPKQKNWRQMDAALEIRAHVFMIELGIKYLMPPTCTTFTLVTDCAHVGYREVDIRLMKGLMEVCSVNYPDRIGSICIGPLTSLVKTLTRMLSPLLPVRLQEKAKFLKHTGSELKEFMAPEIIPTFMGGTAIHCLSARGVENEFDFAYMLESQQQRLQAMILSKN